VETVVLVEGRRLEVGDGVEEDSSDLERRCSRFRIESARLWDTR
jgi:hypothetical protein